MPGQVVCVMFQVGNVLLFQIKHRCLLNSLSSVLQITPFGRNKIIHLLLLSHFEWKKKKKKRMKDTKIRPPKNPRRHFQNIAIANYPVGFTHLSFYYTYSSISSLSGLLIASLIILLNSNTPRLDCTVSMGVHQSYTL